MHWSLIFIFIYIDIIISYAYISYLYACTASTFIHLFHFEIENIVATFFLFPSLSLPLSLLVTLFVFNRCHICVSLFRSLCITHSVTSYQYGCMTLLFRGIHTTHTYTNSVCLNPEQINTRKKKTHSHTPYAYLNC